MEDMNITNNISFSIYLLNKLTLPKKLIGILVHSTNKLGTWKY